MQLSLCTSYSLSPALIATSLIVPPQKLNWFVRVQRRLCSLPTAVTRIPKCWPRIPSVHVRSVRFPSDRFLNESVGKTPFPWREHLLTDCCCFSHSCRRSSAIVEAIWTFPVWTRPPTQTSMVMASSSSCALNSASRKGEQFVASLIVLLLFRVTGVYLCVQSKR